MQTADANLARNTEKGKCRIFSRARKGEDGAPERDCGEKRPM